MISEELKPLSEPITISGVDLRNRIIMVSMGTEMGCKDGSVGQRQIKYYVERAKDSVGLIISEATTVDWPVGGPGFPIMAIDNDYYIPGLSMLADTVSQGLPQYRQ